MGWVSSFLFMLSLGVFFLKDLTPLETIEPLIETVG